VGSTQDLELAGAYEALMARYGLEASQRTVRWSGGEIRVLEFGEGPPLLLVHGGGDAAFEWIPIMADLGRTHRVYAFDRPGHGLSDPSTYRHVDLVEHATRLLDEVLDALELRRVTILANSIGGFLATSFTAARPERVSRLIIAGAPPGVSRDVPLPMRLIGMPIIGNVIGRLALGSPSPAGSRKFWGQMLVAHPERLPDDLFDADAAHMRRNWRDVLSLVRELIGAGGIRRPYRLEGKLATLAVPMLFIVGDRDAFMSANMRASWETIAASNPRVTITRVADAGHLPWMDQPEAVLDAVRRFLTEPGAMEGPGASGPSPP
jgi:pimeloyl-ACP methyl ester carboxylesterase